MRSDLNPAVVSRISGRRRSSVRSSSKPWNAMLEALESRCLLAVTGVIVPNPILPNPVAGTSFTSQVATFTASDNGPFSAVINWGDGFETNGSVTGTGPYVVTGNHTYTSATITNNTPIIVTVTDSQAPTAPVSALGSAFIQDAVLTPTPVVFTETRGINFTTDVATFTSANPYAQASSFSSLINWNDGSPNTAGVVYEDASKVFHVVGSHTYNLAQTFPVTVSVLSAGGATFATNPISTANIVESTIVPQSFHVTATAGVPLNGFIVTTFTDTGGALPVSNYSAVIDWGDGQPTSNGTITSTGGNNFQIAGSHIYHQGGDYPVSLTISKNNIVEAVTTLQANVAFVPVGATPINFTVPERTRFSGTIASFIAAPGTNNSPSGYAATIDWGDGTPPTQGQIQPIPGGFLVNGIHTYTDARSTTSQIYPVTITINDLTGHTNTQVVSQATVDDIPITLTGQLNPATDTGLSQYDAITSDQQPAFFGSSEPYSTVTVYAQAVGGGGLITLGQTQAGASGVWNLTSAVALPTGTYVVTSKAVDLAGFTTANIQILPNAVQGPLVIDTVGPRVTSLSFNPLIGQLAITYQDNLSGVDQQTLIDGANYRFTGQFVHGHLKFGQKFLVTNLTTTPATATGLQTVIITINNGHLLRGGLYNLFVQSGGISGVQDVAGNALDGEFYGFFPSGNGRVGGNFGAGFNFIHGFGSIPLPETSSASPNANIGTQGTPFRVFRVQLPHHSIGSTSQASTIGGITPGQQLPPPGTPVAAVVVQNGPRGHALQRRGPLVAAFNQVTTKNIGTHSQSVVAGSALARPFHRGRGKA